MCGLCGVLADGALDHADLAALERMTDLMAHRGPDGRGTWTGGPAALGHRRLVIIDRRGGAQPMSDGEGRPVLVYNGEIYNFRDLRTELVARGHHFRSSSDTEVVLRGYEEWGPDVVDRLRGMFAFAIWDPARARLVLARDRMGVKPLYLTEAAGGRVVFASEIKALLAHPGVPRRPNLSRLGEQLAFRMIVGEETLFDGVREVPPATVLVREDGRWRRRVYWTPEVPPDHDGDLRAHGRRLIVDAVGSRLVSDVPLGTVNSGGLDSSLIAAIAAERVTGQIDSFCVGLAEYEWDERPQARRVADHIGSRHHEAQLTPERVLSDLDALTWANDEPLHVTSSIGLSMVYQQARERRGVKVLLSGEGADEVFGGYRWYHLVARREAFLRLPGVGAAASHLPRVGAPGRLRRLLGRDLLLAANAFVAPATAAGLAGVDPADVLAGRRAMWPTGGGRDNDQFVYDQRTYLQHALQRQDRMSMAAAVEAREPFLDHPLVEWANGLGVRARLPGGLTKGLLKALAAPWLPDEIVHRPKNGFGVPFGEWMRRGEPLWERLRAITDAGGPLAGWVDGAHVRRLVDEHGAGAADHRSALWSLLALDAWARVFLGPEPRAATLPGSGP